MALANQRIHTPICNCKRNEKGTASLPDSCSRNCIMYKILHHDDRIFQTKVYDYNKVCMI